MSPKPLGPKLIILSLFICFPLTVLGSELKLNWNEALRRALEKNPRVKAAENELAATASRLRSSQWQFAPRLTAEAAWGQSGGSRSRTGTENTYSTTLGVHQNIFNLTYFGDLSQAQAAHDSRKIGLEIAKLDLIRSLKTTFAKALYSQRLAQLSKSIIERRRRNLELVELRYEGGRENRGAVLLSKANLEDARLEQLQAENALKVSLTELKTLMELEEAETIVLDGEPPISPPPTQVDYESLLQSTPERVQALANEKQKEAAITSARGDLFPSLGLSANIGRYGDQFLPQTDGWSVGVTLSIPFGNGPGYYRLQAARADAYAESYKRRSTENDLRVRIENAHRTYIESDKRVAIAEDFLKATRARAEIARKRYELGLVSFDEWDRIESDLVSRERAALQAKRDRIIAEAEWEYLIGKGDNL